MVLLPLLRVSIGTAPPQQRFEMSRRVSRRMVEVARPHGEPAGLAPATSNDALGLRGRSAAVNRT